MAINIPRDYLRQEYLVNKRTTIDIANELDVSINTVRNKLVRYNIPLRSPSESYTINISKKFWKKYNKEFINKDPIDNILTKQIDCKIQELKARMEPLEDLLTGMRINYDILMEKKNLLGIDKDIVIALDSIAAEG